MPLVDGLENRFGSSGAWEELRKWYLAQGTLPGPATRHVSQIRYFYTAPEDTRWVAFCFGRLFWCRARPEVTLLADGTKTRHSTDGSWHDEDAHGNRLHKRNLSGRILSTEGFRGTICRFSAEEALLRTLDGVESPEVVAAQTAAEKLETALRPLIAQLSPKDFEILVDLIFRAAGYQRVTEIGEHQRDIDLDLISPLTNEHVAVQVKSSWTRSVLKRVEKELEELPDYRRLYVAVHSPSDGLQSNDEVLELLLPDRIAALSLRYGLVEWLVNRTR